MLPTNREKIITLVFFGDDKLVPEVNVVLQCSSNVFKHHGRTGSIAHFVDGSSIEQQRCGDRSIRDALCALHPDRITCAELYVGVTKVIDDVIDHLLGCL